MYNNQKRNLLIFCFYFGKKRNLLAFSIGEDPADPEK